MHGLLFVGLMFIAKVIDNALSTAKTILIQRSRWIIAGVIVMLSDFIYFWVTKNIVSAESSLMIIIVSISGGIGCSLACFCGERFSKSRTYVNVIMSDNMEAMKGLRDFLAEHHITNVAADSYTLDWDKKTISITAYPENKSEIRLINNYIEKSDLKFKQVIRKT